LENPDFGPIELANQLHFSESQLYRKLKATSGKSTAIFIRSTRLQLAKDLLITTNKSISEIAYEVGFNDPAYFSRAFKKEFGQAPSEVSKKN
jgi:AraC-like DNA-binding protein